MHSPLAQSQFQLINRSPERFNLQFQLGSKSTLLNDVKLNFETESPAKISQHKSSQH
jgi:hypothetical protein